MPKIVVVNRTERDRVVMVWLTWEELCSLSPGKTVQAIGGELVVHTGDHTDQWWQFCEALKSPLGAHRVVIPTDAVTRLKSYRRVANGNGFDLKPVEDANFHAIAWNPDDLCPKCHEPIREEAKFCADCGVTLPRVLDAPPPAFSDTITFSVVDKPAKPEDAEKAIVLEEPATT